MHHSSGACAVDSGGGEVRIQGSPADDLQRGADDFICAVGDGQLAKLARKSQDPRTPELRGGTEDRLSSSNLSYLTCL